MHLVPGCPRVVGADDVDHGGGLAPLHHVDDVVRVGQVEAEIEEGK